jgi:hypothetical protein
VIQVTFGSRTHSGGDLLYTLNNVTSSIINNAAYFTYVNPNGNWYSLPGTTSGGSREYRTYIVPGTTNSSVTISRVAGTGNDVFSSTRIVIIPANDLRTGRKGLPNVDFSDYEAVKKYYNLPD